MYYLFKVPSLKPTGGSLGESRLWRQIIKITAFADSLPELPFMEAKGKKKIYLLRPSNTYSISYTLNLSRPHAGFGVGPSID